MLQPLHDGRPGMSRVLGVDLGAKRIGLAVADAGVGIARPLSTVNRGATPLADAETIGRVCREQAVTELVVGLPVEARGTEGEMAAAAREWAAALSANLNLPVTLRDERLSSFEAEQRLGRMPRGRSGGPPSRTQRNAFRARIDREAASVILQDELDARRGAAGGLALVARVPPDAGVADGDAEDPS
ncbi:MAG TPA: Holliday junction resolvase RuvX [Candidatus Limnocylindrales bacterium]|nr:Holliday junction resolvase RuvX [Candidatus Limnocylindrales bacterium]